MLNNIQKKVELFQGDIFNITAINLREAHKKFSGFSVVIYN